MSDLDLRQDGTTLWITLGRSSLSTDLAVELGDLADSLRERDDIRAVVIGGTDDVFCTGADYDADELREMSSERALAYFAVLSRAVDCVGKIAKPTIAALNGAAEDAGLELALACDFRIAVSGATFGLTAVRQGGMPGASGTQRLPRLLGEARAKELILTGRRIPAARALEIGLVSAVVPELSSAVTSLLEELGGCAPVSLRVAKAAIEEGYGKPLDAALEIESQHLQTTLCTEDWNEGRTARAEKRPPRFEGH